MKTRNIKGQFVKGIIPSNKTHGMYGTRFYHTYYSILGRCNRLKYPEYYLYGGRGIKCLWKNFEEFRDDMYESYLEHEKEFGTKQTTIDRIDNNKGYSKENCRWGTLKEQSCNRRNNRLVTFQGKTECLSTWAEKLNVPYHRLYDRIFRDNWSIKKALTTPLLINQYTKFN